METKKPDDKGHLPTSNVPNKDMPAVHSDQIKDKGVNVAKVEQNVALKDTASVQVVRSGRPTGSDVPAVEKPVGFNREKNLLAGDTKAVRDAGDEELPSPEDNATEQTKRLKDTLVKEDIDTKKQLYGDPNNRIYNKANDTIGQVEHRNLPGHMDGATTGSRSGNPLANSAEHLIGDKVFDLKHDGTIVLKIQNKDKSRAVPFDGADDPEANDISKLKIQLKFPGINPDVSQRHLLITVGNNKACELFFPPDVPNADFLIDINQSVHVELSHLDHKGFTAHPWVIDFYSNHGVTPRPLEASGLGVELMETTLTKE